MISLHFYNMVALWNSPQELSYCVSVLLKTAIQTLMNGQMTLSRFEAERTSMDKGRENIKGKK